MTRQPSRWAAMATSLPSSPLPSSIRVRGKGAAAMGLVEIFPDLRPRQSLLEKASAPDRLAEPAVRLLHRR